MALLCAAEPDCIVPIGQTKPCLYTPIAPNLTCHRQDQSLLGILQYNMEYRQQIADPSFLPTLVQLIREALPMAFSLYVAAKVIPGRQPNGFKLSSVAEMAHRSRRITDQRFDQYFPRF
ncbi:hypothetical protein niasHT_025970 [Heterodera trifolii]|uniref:Uncharacterized protein n=1 Tax=Heterodera trifolii TaxID=157864 RepID=A0ABD2JA68_9BILA